MSLTYTKENGIIIKTFSEVVIRVVEEINALESQLNSIKQANLDTEGNVTRPYTEQEQASINELENSLSILRQ